MSPRLGQIKLLNGRQPGAAEVEKVRGEVARHAEFTAIAERIIEVNEKICEARPAAGTGAPSVPEGEKRGSGPARSRGLPAQATARYNLDLPVSEALS